MFDLKQQKVHQKFDPKASLTSKPPKNNFCSPPKMHFQTKKKFFCKILATLRDSEKSTRQVGYEPTKKCQKQQVERIERKERS